MPLEDVGRGKWEAQRLMPDGSIKTIGHYHEPEDAVKALFNNRWDELYSGHKVPIEDYRVVNPECYDVLVLCKSCKGTGINQERGRGRCLFCKTKENEVIPKGGQIYTYVVDAIGEQTFENRRKYNYGIAEETEEQDEEAPIAF